MRFTKGVAPAVATLVALSVLQLGSQSLQPAISLTSIPAWGQNGSIIGNIYGVGAQPAILLLFAFTPDVGWTGLPGLCAAAAMQNGPFSVDAAPSPVLRAATRFSAYLVPANLPLNCVSGTTTIPFVIQHNAIATATYVRLPQYSTFKFGGLEWYIKDAPVQVSPGPQFFLQSNAYVDSAGQLHLRISPCGGSWCAAEVYTRQAVGYGTYRITINSQLSTLDPNLTLGLFTWDAQAADQYNREWDIEFSRWGNAAAANAQYVVQPYNAPNNMQRFAMTGAVPSIHTVSWLPGQVGFVSSTANNNAIAQWTFNGSTTLAPTPGDAHLHLNFYVGAGSGPAVPVPQEIVLSGFQYTPSGAQVGFSRTTDTIPFQGQSYVVPLTATASNCGATIDTDSPWLSVYGSSIIPAGAPLQYTVSQNVGSPRSGNLILTSTSCNPTLGAQVLTVNQEGLICSPSFKSSSTHLGFLQSMFSIAISGTASPCTWTVTSSAPWLHILAGSSGAGDGTLQAAADGNSDSNLRGAVLSLSNGPVHSVYQDGAGVLFALSPLTAYACGSQTASFGLSWTAPASVEIHVNSPTGPLVGQFGPSGTTVVNGVADGTLLFLVQPSGPPSPATLASARAAVSSNCNSSVISPLGLVNAASYSANSIAPGSLATVFGTNLSPATAQASGSTYPATLGGVSVSIAGRPCPLWYVSPGQINLAVPADIPPGRYTLTVGSASADALVANVSPGIFTLKGDGTGVPLASVSAVLADGSTVALTPYECSKEGCSMAPVVLPNDLTDLYFVLYGTGIRNYRTISASIGTAMAEVVFVGAQSQFPGLDQVNLHLKAPVQLSGVQPLRLQVDGVASNTVSLQFQ